MTVDSVATLAQIRATFDQLTAPPAPTAVGGARPAAAATGSADLFASLIAALQANSATATATTGFGGGTGVTGADISDAAKAYEGVPYVFGGNDRSGIDCTGLVQRALADRGITVGRSMDAQMEAGTPVASLAEAKPGDLIVLDGGAHIVIYAGDGKVTHAPYEGRTVTTQKAWFDDSDIVTIRRVAPAAQSASTGPSIESLQAIVNAQAALLARVLG